LLLGKAMRSTLPIPGTRKLIVCLFLGLSTFIAAHIVNAFVAHSLLVPDMLPPSLPSQDDTLRDSVSPQQLAQVVMTRGLFALPPESSQEAGSSTSAELGPPLEAAKKLLLGDPFTAADAVEMGIANAVLPAGEVANHARRIAERFNSLPPGAVRDTKKLLRRAQNDTVLQAIAVETEIFGRRLAEPEAKEAFTAFFQKRKPNFTQFS